jgi:hypothetical protein
MAVNHSKSFLISPVISESFCERQFSFLLSFCGGTREFSSCSNISINDLIGFVALLKFVRRYASLSPSIFSNPRCWTNFSPSGVTGIAYHLLIKSNLDVLLSKVPARSGKVEIELAKWIGKMDFYNFIKIGRKPLDRVPNLWHNSPRCHADSATSQPAGRHEPNRPRGTPS